MSYITGPGSHDSWMVWTNEANFNTEMNPANFQYVNWQEGLGRSSSSASPSGNVATIGPRKILDAKLSARQGIPVYVPLHSGPRRNTVPAGYVFGRLQQSKSSGSSSERNGTHVDPDGTPTGYKIPNKHYRKNYAGDIEKKFTCPPGYELVELDGKLFCRSEKRSWPRRLGRVVKNKNWY